MKNKSESAIDTLLGNKSFFLGLAMIAVVLYHFYNVSTTWLHYMRFLIPGFIGVDWFIFFSGYSLCFSWNKNDTKHFYLRRIKRIIPMYVVFAALVTTIHYINHWGGVIDVFGIICNLTTLNYYGIGGFFIDWYIPAILLFYLFFPLLYNTCKRIKVIPIIAAILCGTGLYYTDLSWWYDVAIARVPIYCLGILFFIDDSNGKRLSIILSFGFFILFFLGVILGLRGCFLTDMISPVILILIAILLNRRNTIADSLIGKGIKYIGNHSLEIYMGNVITCNLLGLFTFKQVEILILYFLLNIIVSFIMISLNRGIVKIIKE